MTSTRNEPRAYQNPCERGTATSRGPLDSLSPTPTPTPDALLRLPDTDFADLAHLPRGTEANRGAIYVYELNPADGSMVLLTIKGGAKNPAFSRFNPRNNMLYACTELLASNGEIFAYKVNPKNGALEDMGSKDAGGTSTCYITLDKQERNMLLVNYWDATLTTLALDRDTGALGDLKGRFDAYGGEAERKRVASAGKHVNHANNDESSIKERQSEPHLHALVLDPTTGRMA